MISKNTIKLIKSLAFKKYRNKEKLFLIEGDKLVREAMQSKLKIKELIHTSEFRGLDGDSSKNVERFSNVEYNELKKVSLLQHPQHSLAICRIPDQAPFPLELENNVSLFLDGIQDPGNLGTIVRICDWYGIENIFCSRDTVDMYNPKVIQASMGSYSRVKHWYCDFQTVRTIAEKSQATTYGAFMQGENLYHQELSTPSLLVMGNEGKGIRKLVEAEIEKRLSIPNFSTNDTKAESLNVSVATAIICSEFKRAQ